VILHELVTFLTGGTNKLPYAAEVIPLTAAETYELGRNINSVTYRVILGPNVHQITSSAELLWRGDRYSAIGPAMTYTRNGSVHHVELFVSRIGG
jgi:hypothetical protein